MTAPMWVGGRRNNYENHLMPNAKQQMPMANANCRMRCKNMYVCSPGTVNCAERGEFYTVRYDRGTQGVAAAGGAAGQWTDLRRLVPV